MGIVGVEARGRGSNYRCDLLVVVMEVPVNGRPSTCMYMYFDCRRNRGRTPKNLKASSNSK